MKTLNLQQFFPVQKKLKDIFGKGAVLIDGNI